MFNPIAVNCPHPKQSRLIKYLQRKLNFHFVFKLQLFITERKLSHKLEMLMFAECNRDGREMQTFAQYIFPFLIESVLCASHSITKCIFVYTQKEGSGVNLMQSTMEMVVMINSIETSAP